MSVVTVLFTSVAGGLALLFLALVVRKLKPKWRGFHTVLMGAAGLAAIALLSKLVNGAEWLVQWALAKLATASGTALHGTLQWGLNEGGQAVPWIVCAVLLGWLALQMYPRLGALRGGGGGDMRGGGGGLRIGDRLAGLHEARGHTMWIALFTPAAVVAVPPLAHLFQVG